MGPVKDSSFAPRTLNQPSFLEAISFLTRVDSDLSNIVAAYGHPPLWSRPTGFPTLILIILEQQVSLASARAAFNKLEASVGEITPENFLTLTNGELKACGFSRQKTAYCQGLSHSILDGTLPLEKLNWLDDTSARTALLNIRGIGPWTADIYLLMALMRPDIWPTGDLALSRAVQKAKKLPANPTQDMLNEIAANWMPWRAVAARIFWHGYLSSEK